MASSVDIVPSLGQGLSFLQEGPGASPGYGAIDRRRMLVASGAREGILHLNAYTVSAPGTGMTISVAADQGMINVLGDSVAYQGIYTIAPHNASMALDIGAAHATLPRNDLVIAEALDDDHDNGGLNRGRVRVVAGTPTSGAVKTDAFGARGTPTPGNSQFPLAVVNVPAGATTITNTQIEDRRGGVVDGTAAPGDLKATARSTAPDGWMLCDGSAISRTTYAALFAAISTTYGAGNSSTTFNIPDLRGRVPVGVDGAGGRLASNDALGQSGGEETHLLTIGEMPSHGHGYTDKVTGAGGSTTGVASGTSNNLGTQNLTTDAAGGGGAHNNMPPYVIVNYIIKL